MQVDVINDNEDSNCNSKSARSQSDIDTVFQFAKLNSADFKNGVQCLFFSDHLDEEDVKLMELDQHLLDSLSKGEQVEIRGDLNESAVLVTDNVSYDLKDAETSNSFLMIPDMTFGADVIQQSESHFSQKEVYSVVHNYYELRLLRRPKLKKLCKLLEETPFKGLECEEEVESSGKKYTWTDLCDRVQASNQQILSTLTHLNALEYEGYWRMLDFEYLTTVLHHIIQLCEEGDWLQEGIEQQKCVDVLKDLFPEKIILHVLHIFTESKNKDAMQVDGHSQRPFLVEDKVCKHFAELCLRVSGKFDLNDFMKTWQESVPEGMKVSLSQLEGLALIDRDSRPKVIWLYNVDELPEDVTERFEALFEERKKWTLDEITPYIRDLTHEKLDVVALLTKFSRSSLQNGVKMFSSRKNN